MGFVREILANGVYNKPDAAPILQKRQQSTQPRKARCLPQANGPPSYSFLERVGRTRWAFVQYVIL